MLIFPLFFFAFFFFFGWMCLIWVRFGCHLSRLVAHAETEEIWVAFAADLQG